MADVVECPPCNYEALRQPIASQKQTNKQNNKKPQRYFWKFAQSLTELRNKSYSTFRSILTKIMAPQRFKP
jgi:hypothetical protein